jgi:hypothetical protein
MVAELATDDDERFQILTQSPRFDPSTTYCPCTARDVTTAPPSERDGTESSVRVPDAPIE